MHIEETKRKVPTRDYKGRLLEWNRQTFLQDHSYPKSHERFIVLRAHSFRLANKAIGGSGLIDPKEITLGDINYRQFEDPTQPRCDLCEGGDMIPLEERFYSSIYKPLTPRQSLLRRLLGRLRTKWNNLFDRWDQRDL